MIPVKQTKRGGPDAAPEDRGDCFDACLASVLEAPLGECHVPHDAEWWEHAKGVALRHGHVLFEAYRRDAMIEAGADPLTAQQLGEWIGDAYWLASIDSRSLPGKRHVVVMRGGDLAHDPGLGKTWPHGPLDSRIYDALILLPRAYGVTE